MECIDCKSKRLKIVSWEHKGERGTSNPPRLADFITYQCRRCHLIFIDHTNFLKRKGLGKPPKR